jgi:glycerol-3-phosphate dehydrogenase
VREYAATAVDVIARRTRLAFLNAQAAEESLTTIVDIMAEELNWSTAEKKVPKRAYFHILSITICLKWIGIGEIFLKSIFWFQRQYDMAVEFLQTEMGMKVSERTRAEAISVELSKTERDIYTKRFQSIDQEKKGYISINDIRRSLKVQLQEYLHCIK